MTFLVWLFVAGWYRTRRWEKVGLWDLGLVVLATLLMADAGAAFVVATALVITAPPRAWVPLSVAGVSALFSDVPSDSEHVLSPGAWVVPEYGTYSRAYEMPLAASLPSEVPWTVVVLAAGLLVWAIRRRSVPVGLVAVAFGALAFGTAGPTAPGLLPLAAAALAAYPRGRTYPVFAGGIALGVVLLYNAANASEGPAPYNPLSFYLDPLWGWLAVLVVGSALVLWSLVRRDGWCCGVAVATLLAAWWTKPEEPVTQYLTVEFFAPGGHEIWLPLVFPAALPAIVLIAGALVVGRQRRNV